MKILKIVTAYTAKEVSRLKIVTAHAAKEVSRLLIYMSKVIESRNELIWNYIYIFNLNKSNNLIFWFQYHVSKITSVLIQFFP